ncbi:MAG: hypothetical protein Q4A33_02210, partial [Candidatus Saccharibacteria bacterium]|nr:hypothetical protein [Candidatus Saccharibacteria bacterium]
QYKVNPEAAKQEGTEVKVNSEAAKQEEKPAVSAKKAFEDWKSQYSDDAKYQENYEDWRAQQSPDAQFNRAVNNWNNKWAEVRVNPEAAKQEGAQYKVNPEAAKQEGAEVKAAEPKFDAPNEAPNEAPKEAPVSTGTEAPAPAGEGEPEPKTVGEKIERNIRERAKDRGSKVLDSVGDINLVVARKISGEEAEKEAASLAYQAIRERDDKIKANREAKKAEKAAKAKLKAELEGKSYEEKMAKKPGLLGIGVNIVKNIPINLWDRSVGTVQRSFALKNYYKTALAAIEKTGKRSTGQVAIDDMNRFIDENGTPRANSKRRQIIVDHAVKTESERKFDERLFEQSGEGSTDEYSGVIDPDKAVAERAAQARRAGSANFDQGVKLEAADKNDPVVKAMKKFARAVADYDPNISEEDLKNNKEEAQKRAAARKEILDLLNEEFGGRVSNAADIVRMIEHDFGGVTHESLKDPAEHNKAVKEIDNYFNKHFHFDRFRMTESGLAVDEMQAAKVSDKLTVKAGLFVGAGVALGASFAGGMARSFVVQHITNSQIVTATAKVLAATAIGARRGYKKTKQEQMKENIDAALGLDVKKTKGRVGYDSIMLDVHDITEKLAKGAADLNKDGNETLSLAPDSVIKLVGEILARQEFERSLNEKDGASKKKGGKINLFKYRSRDQIERDKAEMYKAINDVTASLRAKGMDVDKLLKDSKEKALGNIESEYKEIRSAQINERWKKSGEYAAMAFAGAAVATVAWDFMRGKKLIKEIGDLKMGTKKFERHGLKLDVVDVNKPNGATAASLAAEEAINQRGQKNNSINKETLKNKSETEPNGVNIKEELEARSDKQLLIEDDKQGGQALGFDKDGDGKIGAGEYLFDDKNGDGYIQDDEWLFVGNKPGINLNSESDLATLNAALRRDYNVEILSEPGVGEKIVSMQVGAYVNSQPNAVKGININDVKEYKQLCSIERPITVRPDDGMELYEVPVDGKIPDGAKLYIDLDGDGPAAPLEYAITDGKAIVPASVLDLQSGGTAKLMGTVRVAKIEDGQFISYTTNLGKKLTSEDMLNTRVRENDGSILSVMKYANANDTKGEVINQAAINGEGHTIENLSETFNGRPAGTINRVPYMMREEVPAAGTAAETVATLNDGTKIPNYQYSGGYKENFDASLNYMFKEKASYVGTPMTLDVNGDGIIDAAESSAYINQMMVRTATNPYVLMQNASSYGVLESDVMNDLGFTRDVLVNRFGITDGQIDTMDELNLFLEKLKLSENADYYDKLVNGTFKAMRTELDGAQFEIVDLGARKATYLNGNNALDYVNASRSRTAVTYYKIVNGEKVYVGNKGFMFGKDNKKPVYDILACEQKGTKNPPKSDLTAERTSDPAAENVSDPVKENTSDPTAENTSDPVAESTKSDPTKEHVSDPNAETVKTDALEENGSEPSAENVSDPAAETIKTDALEEDTSDPVTENVSDPTAETIKTDALEEDTSDPVTENVSDPTAEGLTPKDPGPIDDNMRPDPDDGVIKPVEPITEPADPEPPFEMTPPETPTPTIGNPTPEIPEVPTPGGNPAPIEGPGELSDWLKELLEEEDELVA